MYRRVKTVMKSEKEANHLFQPPFGGTSLKKSGMFEELPSLEGALLGASSDETRVLGARCEQPGLKELTQLFFVWFDHVHRCQSQVQSLYSTYKLRPSCLGLFELEVIVFRASRNVHFLKEGNDVYDLCAVLLGGVYVVLCGSSGSSELGTVRERKL